MGKLPSLVAGAVVVALAVVAVAGGAGGCGGITLVDFGEGGAGGRSDARAPTPTPPPPTGFPLPPPPEPPPPDLPPEPATGCPTTVPINATLLAYKSPFVSAGSCTAGDLMALSTYVENGGTFPGWKTAVTMVCQACIFGSEADPLWKPILETPAGTVARINVGGCIAVASGKDVCGKAYQQWYDCRPQACAGCPAGDTTALQKCLSAASKGPCKKAFDDVSIVCGDQVIADAETACDGTKFVFEAPIRAQCIGL